MFNGGISHEALSLAGHLKLKILFYFYNNSISIDGPTSLAVSDDHKKRFVSYGWNFLEIDGHDEKQIFKALKKAVNFKVLLYHVKLLLDMVLQINQEKHLFMEVLWVRKKLPWWEKIKMEL